MNKKDLISHAELVRLLDYNHETGVFTWKETINPMAKKGRKAGCVKKRYGIRSISIKVKFYSEHLLAWYYYYNIYPKKS